MQLVINLFGGLIAFGWGGIAGDYFLGTRRSRNLSAEPPYAAESTKADSDSPKVPALSVILAACNEEEKLPGAFRSLLAQQYPGDFQIVAVDDRSTDTTGALLDALAREAPSEKSVVILHLTELPKGWLGKNHALYQGAQRATGEWLLFTDADILFGESALSRAVRFAESEKLDHLASFFRIDLRGFWETVFGFGFTMLFTLKFKPWHVRNPKRSNYIGIGGFNMIRRTAYDAIGTHRAIALEVADDMELGHRVKQNGFVSDVIGSADQITVRWQEGGLLGLMNGLNKNAYAGSDYSILTVIGSTALLTGTVIFPFIGVFLAKERYAKAGYLAAIAAIISMGRHHAKEAGLNSAYALTLPIGALLLITVIFRSFLLTERNGGITWRGTFYPLTELREKTIPPVPPLAG